MTPEIKKGIERRIVLLLVFSLIMFAISIILLIQQEWVLGIAGLLISGIASITDLRLYKTVRVMLEKEYRDQ
ncbi:hypothetical protein ACWOEH_03730 [Enterococcus nangangensis]